MRYRYCLFLFAIFFLVSCGKKGDPTLKAFEKPQPVKEINIIHREDELVVSWQYPSTEREKIKGFYLEKAVVNAREATGSTPEFKNIGFLKNNETTFVDKDFKAWNKYLYKIRALSLRSVLSVDSAVFEAAVSGLPKPPHGIEYKIMHDSVEIRWEPPIEASRVFYNVYRSFKKGQYGQTPINSEPITGYFYTDEPQIEETVFYTVRALRNTPVKDEGFPSREIEVKPSAFIPSKPIGVRFAPAHDKVYLMWNENKESWVKKYRIYKRTNDAQAFVLIGESVTPAFADSEPLKTNTFYHITAVGPSVEGAPSEIIEVSPVIER